MAIEFRKNRAGDHVIDVYRNGYLAGCINSKMKLVSIYEPITFSEHEQIQSKIRELQNITKDDQDLLPGKFYWVVPEVDVDGPEEDILKPEPARYLGDNKWSLLGTDDDKKWPLRRVICEITQPED
ncbi:hypothetical protein [Nitrosomonas sp.]|uniref:hypothetical protein n=1 Tax=Nitrosomonas sp. TaxID=42353 RepID=UPI0025D266A2|nr:hypothetical protein [Nitrosomonas sp.]